MARALHKLEVMDAAMGTCDCQMLADDGRRWGSLCCQHGSALCGGQKREPESTGTPRGLCASPSTWGQGISCLALAQGHRDSSAFVSYFGKWAPGANQPQKAPLCTAPSPRPWGREWPEPASSQLAGPATRNGGAGSGTGTSQTCTGRGAGWMGLFWAGDSTKRKECYQVVEGQAPRQQMLPS